LAPGAIIPNNTTLASLTIIEYAASRDSDLKTNILSSLPALLTVSAAATWISLKTFGMRSRSPNATLMAHASHVKQEDLCHAEIILLEALDWRVTGVVLHEKKVAVGM
jgi:hypothetical protein